MNKEILEHYVEYFNKQEGRRYPFSNQTVLCAIITNDKDKALNFMKDKPVVRMESGNSSINWYLDNGERWLWRTWSESMRGCRFYKVAVDQNISDDIFNFFVLPFCASYCCSMEVI